MRHPSGYFTPARHAWQIAAPKIFDDQDNATTGAENRNAVAVIATGMAMPPVNRLRAEFVRSVAGPARPSQQRSTTPIFATN